MKVTQKDALADFPLRPPGEWPVTLVTFTSREIALLQKAKFLLETTRAKIAVYVADGDVDFDVVSGERSLSDILDRMDKQTGVLDVTPG